MLPTRRTILATTLLALAGLGRASVPVFADTGAQGAAAQSASVTGAGAADDAPPAPASVRVIVSMTHVALPPPPLALAIARVMVPAGVETAAVTAAGIRLIAPEGGTIVARTGTGGGGGGNGAGPGARWASGLPGEISVTTGSALAIAAADLVSLRNPGVQPLTIVDAAILPLPARPAPTSLTTAAGVRFRLVAYGELMDLPASRVDITLSRVEAEPGAALPPWLGTGPLLARVDSGAVAVEPATDGAQAAASLGWPSLAGVGPSVPLPRGRPSDLPDGSALFLPAGAAAAIANAGAGPARLLVLRLAESETG